MNESNKWIRLSFWVKHLRMKLLLLTLTLLSVNVNVNVNAQKAPAKSISLSGGYEYHSDIDRGWNATLNYAQGFNKHARWQQEYGVSFGMNEYNFDLDQLPTETDPSQTFNPSFGANPSTLALYRRKTNLRLSAGVSFAPVNGEQHILRIGLNAVNTVLLRWLEHGSRTYWVYEDNNPSTGNLIGLETYPYSMDLPASRISNGLILQVQPHLDYAIRLAENIQLFSRFSVYFDVFKRDESRFIYQGNLGCRVSW